MSGEPQASPRAAAGEQYFTSQPGSASRPGTVRVLLPGLHLELRTDAGVFSPRRLDPGTRLLLDVAPPPPPRGDLLDLGCGYGPIALTLAARAPAATVWAVDVNERALALTRSNSMAAGLPNVRCVLPEDPALPARFGLIWSNPPVRIGKTALHSVLNNWLGRLTADGAAYLVVQRNLGADSLHKWLAESGWPAERVAARAGYRVLKVTGAGRPGSGLATGAPR